MQSAESSGWHMAQTLDAPAVLVVNGHGMALSTAAVVKGFQSLRAPGKIVGVILNRVSPMIYPQLKAVIERECGAHAYGYIPSDGAFSLESRHLGLVTAQEVADLRARMQFWASQAEKSIELDSLIGLMQYQSAIEADVPAVKKIVDVRAAVHSGLPTIAECGGFMYLTDHIGDEKMTGVIHTDCHDM